MTALLETIGLQKAFGAVVAANDISVTIRRGQKLGLIGNNGAGKTTFVNIVTGHLKPDGGRVLLDGNDITRLAPRQVRRNGVSRSFQIPQLFGSLTLEQNLLMALAILREEGMSSWRPARSDAHMAELDQLIARFRLQPYREHTIAVLAGRRAQARRCCHGGDRISPSSCCSTSRPAASPWKKNSRSWT